MSRKGSYDLFFPGLALHRCSVTDIPAMTPHRQKRSCLSDSKCCTAVFVITPPVCSGTKLKNGGHSKKIHGDGNSRSYHCASIRACGYDRADQRGCRNFDWT